MIFTATSIEDVWIIDPEPVEDERGFFARIWCQQEFLAHGLDPQLVQSSISFNTYKGTLRGMHYQAAPYEEVKLIRCTAGAIYDVVIDLRPTKPTFTHYIAVELRASNRRMVYVPKGCAHGFLTLEDHTEVFYQMSAFYAPAHGRGVRWNDPAFDIKWPEPLVIIAERDRTYPDFQLPSS